MLEGAVKTGKGKEEILPLNLKGLRPTERAELKMANPKVQYTRPPFPVDPPCLYRVYKSTVQRLPLSLASLNSNAAFILVCDEERCVLGWFGESCDYNDRTKADTLGVEVMKRDLRLYQTTEMSYIVEGRELPQLLRYFLEKLWTDESAYKGKLVRDKRNHPPENAPVSVGVLDKYFDGTYAVRETAFAAPNASTGAVPRLVFVSVEKNTIAVVNHGEQWDIW